MSHSFSSCLSCCMVVMFLFNILVFLIAASITFVVISMSTYSCCFPRRMTASMLSFTTCLITNPYDIFAIASRIFLFYLSSQINEVRSNVVRHLLFLYHPPSADKYVFLITIHQIRSTMICLCSYIMWLFHTFYIHPRFFHFISSCCLVFVFSLDIPSYSCSIASLNVNIMFAFCHRVFIFPLS